MSEELITLNGIVERITFQNEENGYTICTLSGEDNKTFTAVGTLPYVIVGDILELTGYYVNHPQYGIQFKVDSFEKKLPSTIASIEKYLSSKVIKGIGPITAKRIVERFGLDSFDVIEHNPEWLTDIQGITLKKAKSISIDFIKKNAIRTIIKFCSEYFTPSQSIRIYQKWGSDAVDIIKENPYILFSTFDDIKFETCERVAKDLNFEKNDMNRIKSGILYVIRYNQENNGHVYLPEKKLLESTSQLLSVELGTCLKALEELSDEQIIVRCDLQGKQVVYPKDLYDDERYIVKKLDEISSYGTYIDDTTFNEIFTEIEKQNDIEYAQTQRKAIKEAFENNVFILTGGPGTGKTTIIKAMIDIFSMYGMIVELCAPTGRAAKRMGETTGLETKTIHRMLEAQTRDNDETIFVRNENYPIEADAIIIDECSMIDLKLMASLLRALKKETKIVMIGDINQLPPVGAGSVFKDMIKSDRYNTIELTHIFRQAQKSMIVVSAHAINNGEHIDLVPKHGNDFYYIARQNSEDINSTIKELCSKRIPKKYKYDIYSGIQVISPSRKGESGTENLNMVLQEALNPPSNNLKEKKVRNGVLRVNDKVMQIKNNYSIMWTKDNEEGMGIFNGDIGIITDISLREEEVTVNYDGRIVKYDFTELDQIELAYAVTVHKSQGSEYPCVILPVFRFSPKLLTRNLLYTAVTRAKELVIIVGDGNIMNNMIDNNKVINRYTGLELLMKGF